MPGTKNQNRKAYKKQADRVSACRLPLTCTPAEKKVIDRAAKAAGMKRNAWIRETLLQAAKEKMT